MLGNNTQAAHHLGTVHGVYPAHRKNRQEKEQQNNNTYRLGTQL